MRLAIPILAEVSDKMMSWPKLIFWSVGLVLLAGALIRKKKWLAIVPLPFALMFAFGSLEELSDPFVGPAIVRERGYAYISLSFLPLTAIVVLLTRKKERAEPAARANVRAAPCRGSS